VSGPIPPGSTGEPESRRLVDAALVLAESAVASGFRGPDPYDGLWYPWPRPLVAGRRRRQALMQVHARSPVDIRRVYRRRHPLIPKALGIFGSVGVRAHRLAGAHRAVEIARAATDLLTADRTAGPTAWGYHWDMQTRWSFYPAGSPNVVVTAFAASGLLEAGQLLEQPDRLRRAKDAARWVADDLWIDPEGYFAYHSGRPANIHNASLLGAWLVHVALPEDTEARERVARAVDRALRAQRPDGSWPYGEGERLAWADSFHSGYVLTLLARLREVDDRIDGALARGADHYRRFFDPGGRARLWADRPYPEDAHSLGTGLTTLAALLGRDLIERELLERVARRAVTHGMRVGHAVHRRYRAGSSRVAYLRWCDAHVALGLVDAEAALRGEADAAPRPSSSA
jgi:hypothetical protein